MAVSGTTHAHVACADHVTHRSHRTPWWTRVIAFDVPVLRKLGLAMLAAGAVLAWLPIHPGLLCPLRAATGVPCPFCGMTTSVKSSLRFDFGGAMAANPGGLALVILSLALVVWRPASLRLPLGALLALGAALWTFQLFRFSVL